MKYKNSWSFVLSLIETEILKLHILTQNSTHFIFIARQSDYGLFQAQYKRWLHKEFWYFMRNVSNIVFVSRTGAKRNWKCVKWAKKSHWIKASQIWDLSQHEMYWEMFLSFVWRPTSGNESIAPVFPNRGQSCLLRQWKTYRSFCSDNRNTTQDIVWHDQCFWAQKADARYDNLWDGLPLCGTVIK